MPRTVSFTLFADPGTGVAIKESPRAGLLFSTIVRVISSATVGKRKPVIEILLPNDEVFYRCSIALPVGQQQSESQTRFYVFGGAFEELNDFVDEAARVACPPMPVGKGWKICVRDINTTDAAGDEFAFLSLIQE